MSSHFCLFFCLGCCSVLFILLSRYQQLRAALLLPLRNVCVIVNEYNA
jgi:VanZ family protein